MPDSPCCCESNPIEFRYAGSDPGRHGAGNSTASVVSGTPHWRVRAISPYLETGNVQALLTTWNLQGRAHCPVCVLKCLRWMKQTVKTYSPTVFSLPCKVDGLVKSQRHQLLEKIGCSEHRVLKGTRVSNGLMTPKSDCILHPVDFLRVHQG